MIDQNQQKSMNNQPTPQQKQQVALQKQFAMRKQQMDKAKLQAKQQGKLPVNAESLDAKISSLVSQKISSLSEAGDWWHPDPEKDKKLPGRGPQLRAREDSQSSAKPDYSKSLKPGESYMDFAKRKARGESYVPGKPAERLGAVTAIPQSERDAAKARLLAKTAAKRKEMEKVKEEFEIEEGKQTFPYKKVAAKIKDKLSRSVYAKTDNSPVPNTTDAEKKATTQMSKMAHVYNKTKRADQDAAKARRSSTFYRDTHPASAPKMKKANEETLSFSNFIAELNRYEKQTGKDLKTGKPVTKGGTMGGDDTNSKVMRHMHKVMGSGRMGAGGAIQKRGEKKVKGAPTPGPSVTPAQKVANRRAAADRARDMLHSRYD